MDTAPALYSPSESYADACRRAREEKEETARRFQEALEFEEQETERRIAARNRKRAPPPPSGSDDEQASVKKTLASANTSDTDDSTATPTNTDLSPPAPSNATNPETTPRLKFFMAAMEAAGKQRSTLMKQIPAEKFYTCRGYYLHHKLGDFTEEKGRNQRLGTTDKDIWASLVGTVRQDSFASLLRLFGELSEEYEIFSSF